MTLYVALSEKRDDSKRVILISNIVVILVSCLLFGIIVALDRFLPHGEYNEKTASEIFSDIGILVFVTVLTLSVKTCKKPYLLLPGIIISPAVIYMFSEIDVFHISITKSSFTEWKPEVTATMVGLFAIELASIIYYATGNDAKLHKATVLVIPGLFVISSIICIASDNCEFHFHHASLSVLMLWLSQLRTSKIAALVRGFFLGIFLNAIATFNDTGVITAMFRPW